MVAAVLNADRKTEFWDSYEAGDGKTPPPSKITGRSLCGVEEKQQPVG